MKKKVFVLFLLLLCLLCSSCAGSNTGTPNDLLNTKDFMKITLGKAEGSGGLRTLTITYTEDGQIRTKTLEDISYIDNEEYDDEIEDIQVITSSDCNDDGIFDVIVYRELWITGVNIPHAGVATWPTLYEFDIRDGFIIASDKYKEYYSEYARILENRLSLEREHMDDGEIKIKQALIQVALQVADGSFVPTDQYDFDADNYPDVNSCVIEMLK